MTIVKSIPAALAAAIILLVSSSNAFQNCPKHVFASRTVSEASPTTQVNLFNIFNEGKKALVKKIAGDYDAEAIRARIDGLINDSPVLMLR